MEINGFVLCVCQGTCPSFKKMNIFNVLSDVRREKIFDYVCLHPQLCVGDGEEFSAVPRLLVTDDRAKLTHEAAIGSVDKKQVETLMARGLTEEESVDVVVRGILR